MRDKLTKKRLKVDYYLIVDVLDLNNEFYKYVKTKKQISLNRLALAFLKKKKIDYEYAYYCLKEKGITSYQDYKAELIRICKTNWLED